MINNKLLTELEIIKDHCNDTGLKAGAGVIEEVIEILKSKNIIEVPLLQVEFEENWISFELTPEQMKDGFHAGKAKIDISGIQTHINQKGK